MGTTTVETQLELEAAAGKIREINHSSASALTTTLLNKRNMSEEEMTAMTDKLLKDFPAEMKVEILNIALSMVVRSEGLRRSQSSQQTPKKSKKKKPSRGDVFGSDVFGGWDY